MSGNSWLHSLQVGMSPMHPVHKTQSWRSQPFFSTKEFQSESAPVLGSVPLRAHTNSCTQGRDKTLPVTMQLQWQMVQVVAHDALKCPGPRVPSGKIKFDIPRATPRSHENEFFPAHDFVLKLSAAYKQLPGRSSKIDSSYALQQLAICVPLLRKGQAAQAAQLRQPLRISAGTSVTSVSMTRSLDPHGAISAVVWLAASLNK